MGRKEPQSLKDGQKVKNRGRNTILRRILREGTETKLKPLSGGEINNYHWQIEEGGE
jgi:hypothetical protein